MPTLREAIQRLLEPERIDDSSLSIQWVADTWDEKRPGDVAMAYIGLVSGSSVEGILVAVTKVDGLLACRIDELGRP